MGSGFWAFLGVVLVTGIIVNGVVKIIKAAKSGGGKSGLRIDDMEEQVHDMEADLADTRKRIEVLEKIVTDQRYDLSREINNLSDTGTDS